tara:strand:- start:213 stop:1160 length:948 start_codon:yes stop_codon:yes gene_type:complete
VAIPLTVYEGITRWFEKFIGVYRKMPTSENSIEMIIEPKVSDLGDGFQVRRLLPSMKRRNVGPFVFWDHMGPVEIEGDKELKVRAHPHIGLSTLTYLFQGQIFHRDSLGNEQAIRPGEINWMTAGKWVAHSERSDASMCSCLEGIQVWVALPKESEDVAPSFDHHKKDSLPTVSLGEVPCILIAGEWKGTKSPVQTYSPLFYFNVHSDKDQHFEAEIPSGHESAIYLIHESITLKGQEFQPGSLVIFESGSKLKFSIKANTHFMFFGGDAFPEKRHIFWNFVSSDPGKIEKAKEKWLREDYVPVINETEYIPLPK